MTKFSSPFTSGFGLACQEGTRVKQLGCSRFGKKYHSCMRDDGDPLCCCAERELHPFESYGEMTAS